LPVPVPRQEFVNAFGGVILQAGQHVGEPSLRIDTVELGCGDQRVDRSGAPAAVVGAGEGPVLSPESNGRQLAFRRVVRLLLGLAPMTQLRKAVLTGCLLLYPGAEPGIERHCRSLRQNVQARLRSRPPMLDAATVLRQIARWFDDYNESHPHSGLGMISPREFIRAQAR
jgi:transposase InsO family protein